jgi:hypothetical protein
MLIDSDTIRAAQHMIANHGTFAAHAADRRASDLVQGDQAAAAQYWERIAIAIRSLERSAGARGAADFPQPATVRYGR